MKLPSTVTAVALWLLSVSFPSGTRASGQMPDAGTQVGGTPDTAPAGMATTGASSDALYLFSLDQGYGSFSAYDPVCDNWQQLAWYDTGSQMAVSTDGELYAYRRSPPQIEVYDPAADTWSYVMDAPPGTIGSYGNLELTRDGEFLYTEAERWAVHYTSDGSWLSMTLPFRTNAMGDYDPTTHRYVVGEWQTVNAHLIDLETWSITDFVLGPGTNGELARFGSIMGDRYYYQSDNDPIRSYDLTDPGHLGHSHGVRPGFYTASAANRRDRIIFVSGIHGTTLRAFDPVAGTMTVLADHAYMGNHSSLAFASPSEPSGISCDGFESGDTSRWSATVQ